MAILPAGSRRFAIAEVVIIAALIAIVSLNALRRMDYLRPATIDHIRMTDASRSAYVGKNIAEGRGYTTNDLPDYLIDLYDQRGKLHEAKWPNADRFPFTPYAIAALFVVAHSTSYVVGILVYNLICFVGFLVVLYLLARRIWGQRWSALLALVIALMHPYTYFFLYLKDADMLLLTTGTMWALYAYLRAPPAGPTRRLAVVLGTLLAWLFLARPNVGAPFVLCFAFVVIRRFVRDGRSAGYPAAARRYATREGLALAIAALWLVPFVIQSMAVWGVPLFSANNLYQLPLGTRYGMGTDTWWKYTEPGHAATLATILAEDRGHLIGKFTTSWYATVRSLVEAYAFEILLLIGALGWMARHDRETGTPAHRPLRALAGMVGIVGLINLAVLPLYGYQNYAYRHYLGFLFPLMWILAGHGGYLILDRIRPQLRRVLDHIRANPGLWIAIAVAAFVLWNLGAPSAPDGNHLYSRTARFLAKHWIGGLIAIVVFAFRSWLFRPPWYPRAVAAGMFLVFVAYRPASGIKRANLIWFPTDKGVWRELAKRHGIVASFALQGEVAWNTGRKNIPVPEWPMHLYSFAIDHHLTIEDVYIESAAALLSPVDGPFSWMAPGFEGYERLQEYPGHLPGYALAFQSATARSYPKFRVPLHPKASTVYTLVDPAAIHTITQSPDRIDLGAEANVIYTAHGWGRYLSYDGKSVVAATDTTRARYPHGDRDIPWEHTSVTFFLDDRRPSSVDLEFYALGRDHYTFYWNLDLYAYDRAADRARHSIGEIDVAQPGWQHVTLHVPVGLTRRGLNKLGFRASVFQPIVFCPQGESDAVCLEQAPASEGLEPAARVVHVADLPAAARARVSMFAQELDFHYGTP